MPLSKAEEMMRLGTPGPVAEYLAKGQPSSVVAGVANIGTADATDLASAITLVNAIKARFNQQNTALKG